MDDYAKGWVEQKLALGQTVLDKRHHDECRVRGCPDCPRERMLVVRMTARLPRDRSKGGKNADIPTYEDDETRRLALFLCDSPAGHEHPCRQVTDSEEHVEPECDSIDEVDVVLESAAPPTEPHDEQARHGAHGGQNK